jgi:hypothetical protein
MTAPSDPPDRLYPVPEPDHAEPPAEPDTATDPSVPSVGLWASLGVLTRRWPYLLLGFVLTAGAGIAVVRAVPVSYSATGTMLLFIPDAPRAAPPGSDTTALPAAANPYLGSRGFVGDLVITIMSDPDAESRVIGRGGTGTYKTTLSLGDAGLIKVATTGKTSAEAMTTWTATADETAASLIRLQKAKGAPEDQLVTADTLTVPLEAQRETGSRTRALIATIVLGLGATLLFIFGAESLSQHRRGRPEAPPEAQPGAGRVRGRRMKSKPAEKGAGDDKVAADDALDLTIDDRLDDALRDALADDLVLEDMLEAPVATGTSVSASSAQDASDGGAGAVTPFTLSHPGTRNRSA